MSVQDSGLSVWPKVIGGCPEYNSVAGVTVKAFVARVRRFTFGHLLRYCFVPIVSLTGASHAQEERASKSAQIKEADLAGKWGGEHLNVSVSGQGASLEFDCAHGRFDKPLRPDWLGRFAVRGIYVEEHGGPILVGEVPKSHRALYTGIVKGNRMTLKVKLSDTHQQIGEFVAKHGEPPRLFKCR